MGKLAKNLITDESTDVFVSVATAWEISIKRSLGKIEFPNNIDSVIDELGFSKLDITPFHAEQAGSLPEHHKDPFDRLIIAQAQANVLDVMTKDKKFPMYCVNLIDAQK